MPNRYLRETFIESERVNAVSWQAEAFWTRLLVKVDDFGRIEANPKLLRAKLYPLKLEQVREADVSRLLAECEKAGLIRLYAINGKDYLQMEKWERGRALVSKYPDPPEHPQTDVYIRKHPLADENISPDPDPDYDTDTDPANVGVGDFAAFWLAYPKKKAKGGAEKAWKKVKAPLSEILAAIEAQKQSDQWKKEGGQFIPYPASWLNDKGWEDELVSHSRSPLPEITPERADHIRAEEQAELEEIKRIIMSPP